MSVVRCQVSGVFFFNLSCGASCWKVCYQRGLLRLVLIFIYHKDNLNFLYLQSYFLVPQENKDCRPDRGRLGSWLGEERVGGRRGEEVGGEEGGWGSAEGRREKKRRRKVEGARKL